MRFEPSESRVTLEANLHNLNYKTLKNILKNILLFRRNNFFITIRFSIFGTNFSINFKKANKGNAKIHFFINEKICISNHIFDELSATDNSESQCLYFSDSVYKSEDGVLNYFARPIFSPLLFSNLDYLGDLLILKNINLNCEDLNMIKCRDEAIKYCLQQDSMKFYRIASALYEEVLDYAIGDFLNVTQKMDTENVKDLDDFLLDLVIPTALSRLVDHNIPAVITLLEEIESSQEFKNRINQIILAVNESHYPALKELIESNNLGRSYKFYTYDYDFNFSRVINECVKLLEKNYFIICNDDIEISDQINFECFLSHLLDEGVGSVGVKLVNTSNRIIHFGIEYFEGSPRHFLNNFSQSRMKAAHSICREVSGSTAAFLGLKKEIFDSVHGLDEIYPLEYNDVDLMLKISKAGFRNIICANNILIHHESLTRDKGINENYYLSILTKNHGPLLTRDPYLFTPYD
jgi:GT2 family glycosyltransferase